MSNLQSLATAPFAEIDRLQAEIKYLSARLQCALACEAMLKQTVQDFIDRVESGQVRSTKSYNAMRDSRRARLLWNLI